MPTAPKESAEAKRLRIAAELAELEHEGDSVPDSYLGGAVHVDALGRRFVRHHWREISPA